VREISFPSPEKMLSPPIIALDNVAVGYEPDKPVINRVTLRIDPDDRIALLGANGNGKTTLVKLIASKLAPFAGQVTRADKLRWAISPSIRSTSSIWKARPTITSAG
jgi:ATP-binding cassette subfamily F protein 3